MKKTIYTIIAALILICGTAMAETVSPYTLDFNKEINTSKNDFKVASGWGHLVDGYFSADDYETYYPSYRYSSADGVGGTGCLKVGSQQEVGTWSDAGATADLLVTPVINGNVSIAVKKSGASGEIKFYAVTEENGKYVKGSEITVSLPELSTDAYTTVTLPVQNDSRIGIWGSNVYIDDFMAETAEIQLVRSLKIDRVELVSDAQPKCTEDRLFPVSVDVTVTNNGETALLPGDENYSLSIIFNSTGEALVTVPIDKALNIGESTAMSLSASVDYDTHNGYKRYDAKENLSGTTSYGAWVEPKDYAPKLVVRDTDGKVENGKAFDFGMISADTEKRFTLSNEGGASLLVSEINMPDGFISSLTAPVTIEPDERLDFTVTMTVRETGVKSGDVIIKGEGIEDFRLTVSGTVFDPDKFYADFEDGNIPAGAICPSEWSVKSWDETGNSKVLSSGSLDMSMFILPLLEVKDGEKMVFSAGRRSYGSNLKVYYSTDRKEWKMIKDIAADDMPSDLISWDSYEYKLGSFVIEDIPSGKYYIAFEAGYANIDNIYGFSKVQTEHDMIIEDELLPANGKVNNPYRASVTIRNINSKPESDYAAKLYFDGQEVAGADPVEIAEGSSRKIEFEFTPHETGTFRVCAKITAGELELVTDTKEVAIGNETMSKDITVGTADGFDQKAPLNLFYKNSESETIYTAEQIRLPQGEMITGLTFSGYNSSGDITTNVELWLENTENAEYAEPYSEASKENMTKVYDGTCTFTASGTDTAPVPMLQVDFDKPFEYTGKNLRIVARSVSDEYKRVYFQCNTADMLHTIARYNDSDLADGTYTATPQPVVVLAVATEPKTLTGTVADTYGSTLAGVAVRMECDDVVYYGTTNSDGIYGISVIQTDKSYTVFYTADGYQDGVKENVTFDEDYIIEKNVMLAANDPTYIVGQPCLVCLPIAIEIKDAIGKFYKLKSYDGTCIKVEEIGGLTDVGMPYIFVPSVEHPFENLADNADAAAAGSITVDNLTLRGSYSAVTLDAEGTRSFYGITESEDKTSVLTGIKAVKPFGAFFTSEGTLGDIPKIEFTGNTSGFVELYNAADGPDNSVYSIDGRKVADVQSCPKLNRGMYIIRGKKILVE